MFSLDYSTVRTIRHTGDGDTTLAIDRRTGKIVLIERLGGFAWHGARMLSSVRSLVRNFMQAEASGLAKIVDIDVTSTTAAIVYAHVDGISLTEFLPRATRLSAEELVRISAQFLATLGDLHETGFYHGALSNDEVVLTSKGIPVLIGHGKSFIRDIDRQLTAPPQADRFDVTRRRRVEADLTTLGGMLEGLMKAWEGDEARKKGLTDTSRMAPMALNRVCSRLKEGRFSTASQALTELIHAPTTDRRVIADRYELRDSLGRGSVGEVFSAFDLVLQHPVAVKILREDFVTDSRNMRRLRAEINLARQIRHPAVVATYDLGEAAGCQFISMELVDGEPLGQVIRRRYSEGLPFEVGMNWFIDVLDGLEAAHRQQVIHRDIKPDNILIDRRGSAHLADFGIALSIASGRITDNGVVLGTPIYMSPEQFRGEAVTPAADLYALGVTMYEAFSRTFPYDADNVVSLALKKLEQKPTPLVDKRPDTPAALAEVVMRALESDPDQRFPSAGAMRDALKRAAGR